MVVGISHILNELVCPLINSLPVWCKAFCQLAYPRCCNRGWCMYSHCTMHLQWRASWPRHRHSDQQRLLQVMTPLETGGRCSTCTAQRSCYSEYAIFQGPSNACIITSGVRQGPGPDSLQLRSHGTMGLGTVTVLVDSTHRISTRHRYPHLRHTNNRKR